MSTGRETFCIMDEPINFVKLDRINDFMGVDKINYFWVPDRNNLSIEPKKTGKSKIIKNERFEEYFNFVEMWDFEIEWKPIFGYSFSPICVNKSNNAIAGTLSMSFVKGKIHLLPKTTKINVSDSIELLIDLAIGKETTEYTWRKQIDIPTLQPIETKLELTRNKMKSIKKEIEALKHDWADQERYRDLFSKDSDKVEEAVQRMLADLGIETEKTRKGHVIDLISDRVAVEVTSIKGKVKARTKKVTQLSRFIEEKRTEEKVIFVANTYKELPPSERINKKPVSNTMKKFLESTDVCFMSTLILYKLWLKTVKKEMSVKKASSLILKEDGLLKLA